MQGYSVQKILIDPFQRFKSRHGNMNMKNDNLPGNLFLGLITDQVYFDQIGG